MNKFTTSFSVDLPGFEPFCSLVPELQFTDVADLAAEGPFVYVLVEPRGGIVYIGKSDAATGTVGRRALAYSKWSSEYLAQVADGGRPDPLYDPKAGELGLAGWAPIIRFVTRHQAIVRVASVAATGLSGKVWEARLQALAGTLTGLESLVGGSGWEAKPGTLRDEGYDWALDRIRVWREKGLLGIGTGDVPNFRVQPGDGMWQIVDSKRVPLAQVISEGEYASQNGEFVELSPVIIDRAKSVAKYLQDDPTFLGEDLLVIGRDVPFDSEDLDTIDFLALDEHGIVHVVVVAPDEVSTTTFVRASEQAFWVEKSNRGPAELDGIFANYRSGDSLERAFLDHFDRSLPKEITGWPNIVIVGSRLDDGAESLLRVAERESTPRTVTVVTFEPYRDAGSTMILVRRNVPGREIEMLAPVDDE